MEISQSGKQIVWQQGEIERVRKILWEMQGIPYKIGYEDKESKEWIVRGKPGVFEAPDQVTEVDCSGLSRYIIAQGVWENGERTLLPHGTKNQIIKCDPVVGVPRSLDLGFAGMKGPDEVDHVIIRYSDTWVIEARGEQKGRDYGKVIKRPVKVWENWKGFWGWYRPRNIRAEGIK